MSPRRQSNVKKEGFIDAKYSSGDNNKMISKPYKEENNNEVNELSEELQMGCIVDAVKRPPNICVETCIYEDESETEGTEEGTTEVAEDDAYSDEFEEDRSDDGEESIKLDPKLAKSETIQQAEQPQPSIKLSKSHSFMSSKNESIAGKSGTSSQYGSMFVPRTRRVNMSFANSRLREIERHNHILLNKILSARNVKKSSIPPLAPPVEKRPPPPAAVNRKKQQRQIDHENMILLRRIQRAKSSASSIRR